jgi:hypothetical protein
MLAIKVEERELDRRPRVEGEQEEFAIDALSVAE